MIYAEGGISKGPSNSGSVVGGQAINRPETTLQTIADRINRTCKRIMETSAQLDAHADRVSGPVPETNETMPCTDMDPTSQIGAIFAALDRLEGAAMCLDGAASRNCTLA